MANGTRCAKGFYAGETADFWEELLFIIIGLESDELDWIMIDASFIKAHPHAAGAVGGNQDMECTKGGLTQKYIWPWMRTVCRSDALSQQVPLMIAQKLWTYWRV